MSERIEEIRHQLYAGLGTMGVHAFARGEWILACRDMLDAYDRICDERDQSASRLKDALGEIVQMAAEVDRREVLRAEYEAKYRDTLRELEAARKALGEWSKHDIGQSLVGAINNLRQAQMIAMEHAESMRCETAAAAQAAEAARGERDDMCDKADAAFNERDSLVPSNSTLALRAEHLAEALRRIMKRILADSPQDVAAAIASGRTINEVYILAKTALALGAPPVEGMNG